MKRGQLDGRAGGQRGGAIVGVRATTKRESKIWTLVGQVLCAWISFFLHYGPSIPATKPFSHLASAALDHLYSENTLIGLFKKHRLLHSPANAVLNKTVDNHLFTAAINFLYNNMAWQIIFCGIYIMYYNILSYNLYFKQSITFK